MLAEAGEAFARTGGTKAEALHYLGSSHEVYPNKPENDPTFLYADCPYPVLSLYQGLAYMDFNQPKEAYHAFSQVEKLPATIIVPERIRLEIINHKAKAAIALGDLDLSTASITTGVNGAKTLGSQKRYSEAREAYQQMVVKWPKEQVVKDIAGLFQA